MRCSRQAKYTRAKRKNSLKKTDGAEEDTSKLSKSKE